MTTQNGSNELRVEKNVDIEEDLKNGYNIDLATATFEAEEMEKALGGTVSTGSGEGAAANPKVTIRDGKAANIVQRMVPITQSNTIETPASELDDKKKALIEKKARDSKNREKEKEGIGE